MEHASIFLPGISLVPARCGREWPLALAGAARPGQACVRVRAERVGWHWPAVGGGTGPRSSGWGAKARRLSMQQDRTRLRSALCAAGGSAPSASSKCAKPTASSSFVNHASKRASCECRTQLSGGEHT